MFAAVAASRRWLMEAFMFRFHPQMPLIFERFAASVIGRVLQIRSIG